MLLIFKTSFGVNCSDTQKGGIFKEVPGIIKSEIKKPLSAKTKSPGCNICKIPQ
jgi:hypothetical protein